MPKRYPDLVKHGGKRAGAGRKRIDPNKLTDNREIVRQELHDLRDAAAKILRLVDVTEAGEVKAWRQFLTHKDPRIRLRARIELTKLAYASPKQADAQPKGNITITIVPSKKPAGSPGG